MTIEKPVRKRAARRTTVTKRKGKQTSPLRENLLEDREDFATDSAANNEVSHTEQRKNEPKNRYRELRNKQLAVQQMRQLAERPIEIEVPNILPDAELSEEEEDDVSDLYSTETSAFNVAAVEPPPLNAFSMEPPKMSDILTSDDEFEAEPEPSDAESLGSEDSYTSYDESNNEKDKPSKNHDIIDEMLNDPPIDVVDESLPAVNIILPEHPFPVSPPSKKRRRSRNSSSPKKKRKTKNIDDDSDDSLDGFITSDKEDNTQETQENPNPPSENTTAAPKGRRPDELSQEDILKLGALKLLSFSESSPYLKGITKKCNEDFLWNAAFAKCIKKWRKTLVTEMKPHYMLLAVTGLMALDVVAANRAELEKQKAG